MKDHFGDICVYPVFLIICSSLAQPCRGLTGFASSLYLLLDSQEFPNCFKSGTYKWLLAEPCVMVLFSKSESTTVASPYDSPISARGDRSWLDITNPSYSHMSPSFCLKVISLGDLKSSPKPTLAPMI